MRASGIGTALAVVLVLSTTALAQVTRSSVSPPSTVFTPGPQSQQPSPGTGQGSRPSPSATTSGRPTDPFVARPGTYAPRFSLPPSAGRSRRGFSRLTDKNLGYGAFAGGYGYIPDYSGPPISYIPSSRPPAVVDTPAADVPGFLRLEVQPSTAQVFVDGFYSGTVDEFSRAGIALAPGPHRVEIRAPGREPLTFDVLIAPNETIIYRNDLELIRPAATAAPASPTLAKTFYVIPGCYAGDRLPDRAQLPKGCDGSKVRTIAAVKAP